MIQTVVTTGVVSFFIMMMLSTSENMAFKQRDSISKSHNISYLRTKIFNQISLSQSWYNTYATDLNIFKKCVEGTAEVDCMDTSANRPFNLMDSTESIVVKSSGSLFDARGESCNPDVKDCPFKVENTWRPICVDSKCYQVVLDFKFYSNQKSGWEREGAYDFHVLKNMTMVNGEEFSSTPTVTYGEKSFNGEVKIVLILDASDSMVDKRQKVINSLTSTLVKAAAIDAKVLVYSTVGADMRRGEWSPYNDKSLAAYMHAVKPGGDYELTSQIMPYEMYIKSHSSEEIEYEARLLPDISTKLGIDIRSSKPEAEIRTALATVFDYLKPYPGTERESGICTIVRMVNDKEGPNNILGGDKSVHFVVVSDENDYMGMLYADRCEKGVRTFNDTVEAYRSCDVSTETCEYGEVVAKFHGLRVSILMDFVQDDIVKKTSTTVCSPIWKYDGGKPCPWGHIPNGSANACDSQALAMADKIKAGDGIHSSAKLKSCVISKSYAKGTLDEDFYENVPESVYASYKDSDGDVDCSKVPVVRSGTTHANIQTAISAHSNILAENYDGCNITFYVKDDKTITKRENIPYYKMPSFGNIDSEMGSKFSKDKHLPLFFQKTIEDLEKRVASYSITTIIHDRYKDPSSCDMGSGTYGDLYIDFLGFSNSSNNHYSLCDSTYDIPFENLKTSIEAAILSTVTFEGIPDGEILSGIKVMREGEELFLSDSDYDLGSHSVTFKPGLLQLGDEIIAYTEEELIL